MRHRAIGHPSLPHLTAQSTLESTALVLPRPLDVTMRRFAHCLILLLAPSSVVWADDAFNLSQRGACVYTDSAAAGVGARARNPRSEPVPVPSPRSSATRPGSEGGGGGSEDDLMQRMRAPRWHSFLPGMFR